MAYSESLAARVRQVLGRRRGLGEKKMFGGVGFLLDGNLCVGVWKTSLIARLGEATAANALDQPHVVAFDVTGRPMRGWVMIEADGLETDARLRDWIEQSVDFVATLPRKHA
jgi:TfoX/Sxy family transcriptional regulator of competence genes